MNGVPLKKRIAELQGQLEGIEEQFVLGQWPLELYEKYSGKYKAENKGNGGTLVKISV